MAPEQISGQRIDGRADVFSVGVVLYEVLTTEHLFPGDSLEAIFFATLSKKPPLLSLPDGTELPALQKILHRALARHPEKRYPSAEELGQALETFLEALEKKDPKKKLERRKKRENSSKTKSRLNESAKNDEPAESRYISSEVSERVHARAHYQCQFCSSDGRRCSARTGLQLEHLRPFGIFHSNDERFLQLYCAKPRRISRGPRLRAGFHPAED